MEGIKKERLTQGIHLRIKRRVFAENSKSANCQRLNKPSMILFPLTLYSEKLMKKTMLFIAAGFLVVGCAAIDEKTVTESTEKQFITGSNLPQRDRTKSSVRVVSPESIETSGTAPSASRMNN